MRFTSLIQLSPAEFDIHFPAPCCTEARTRLGRLTELLQADPVPDLRRPEMAALLPQVDILVTG